jgi:acetyl-CoA carboxylase biotin carboxyl carrier protein
MAERSETPTAARRSTPEELRAYYELMRERDLSELEIREGDFYLKLSRPSVQVKGVPVSVVAATQVISSEPVTAAEPAPPKEKFESITSPLAGVFYRAAAPSSPPFVKEGDTVAYGDILCIVEAMKVMNEIRSNRPGKIKKILAENGKPVAAGQDLFLLDPAS